MHAILGIIILSLRNVVAGALFGGMAAAQTAGTYFGSLVFGAIYESTVYLFNGTVFMFMAGLCFISFVLSM